MTGTIRVGTSGWSYDHWDGTFYPDEVPRSRWSAHYRSVFPTVEINYTFYRLPRATTITKWHDEAPDRFRYVAKGSRLITHIRRLADCEQEVATYLERVAPLKTYLAMILWQLPPTLERDLPLLDDFLHLVPRELGGSGVRHAVEFRHPSWVDDATFAVLDRHRATHVWVSSLQMPANRTRTGDLVYARFHGLEGGFSHDYSAEELTPFAQALAAAADDGMDGFAFFNNDGATRAPANAQLFRRMLGSADHPWPPR